MARGLVSGAVPLLPARHGTSASSIVCGPSASATLELEDAAEAGEVLVSPRTAEALTARRRASATARSCCDRTRRRELPAARPTPQRRIDLAQLLLPPRFASRSRQARSRRSTARRPQRSSSSAAPTARRATRAGGRRALGELADVVSAETFERRSPGSSRTSTATAGSSTSSRAPRRSAATTRSACCAPCARSSTRSSGLPDRRRREPRPRASPARSARRPAGPTR